MRSAEVDDLLRALSEGARPGSSYPGRSPFGPSTELAQIYDATGCSKPKTPGRSWVAKWLWSTPWAIASLTD